MSQTHAPRLRSGLALLLAGMIALTGCGAEVVGRETSPTPTGRIPISRPTSKPSPESGVLAPPAGRVAWRYQQQRPVTRFAKVDGVLVGYTLKRMRLRMTALDPADGSVIWDRAASPGSVPPGVAPELTTVGKNVVLLEPSDAGRNGNFWTTVIVVAAKTGRSVAMSEQRYWIDGLPQRCGRRICFDGYAETADAERDGHRTFVMNPSSGRVSAAGEQTTYRDDLRSVGDAGLVQVEKDGVDAIGRVVDGELSWQRPLPAVFGEDYSTDGGWQFRYDKKTGLYTGEVGWFPGTEKPIPADLRRRAMMVGLDAETGEVRWRKRGVSRSCSPVLETIELIADNEDYRCRYRSGFRNPEQGAGQVLEEVGVSIQRFDLKTGTTIWEVDTDASTADDWQAWSTRFALWDDHSLLAHQDGALVVIDIDNGAVVEVSDDEVGWGVTDSLVEPRDGSGALTEPARVPPEAVSVEFGTLRVVTGPRAVMGVQAG